MTQATRPYSMPRILQMIVLEWVTCHPKCAFARAIERNVVLVPEGGCAEQKTYAWRSRADIGAVFEEART